MHSNPQSERRARAVIGLTTLRHGAGHGVCGEAIIILTPAGDPRDAQGRVEDR